MPEFSIGLHFSHEQLSPSALLTLARAASDAGFQRGMCSDHFHPWSARQGHSGFTWSWLGAALEATQMTFGTVCAPGQRYHPAIIAQAAATLAEMNPDRFWLAIGSGEALNERITGEDWPPKEVRNHRLREAADVMRRLWAGETVSTRGHVHCAQATLYSRPARPPLLLAAALSPETARIAATWADGMITAGVAPEKLKPVIDAFRDGGGEHKPMFLQVPLAFASSMEEARRVAHEQWRQCVLPPQLLADLESPEAFDRAVAGITAAEVAESVRISDDIHQHAAWIEEYRSLGFDGVYLHNVVRSEVRAFIEACGAAVLPQLRGGGSGGSGGSGGGSGAYRGGAEEAETSGVLG